MRKGVILMGSALLAALLAVSGSALAESARFGWQVYEERQQRWARDERQRTPRRGERRSEVRPRPRVEVVIPFELLPQASQPGVPASPPEPAAAAEPDEPLVLDCWALAERIERLRDGTSVGTRQLRERRDMEARYRRACQ
ncbi:hypothetical protein IEI94_07110 [Halomonas sp. ML-15]|uniref:hypothetical protein n=1 Tax=Halomonas sp. ML-15 TaxID=2773305 RepID=UPI001747BAD1|nr:hypothetical protein [Halomonas sp. ML-15]MBD3895618.1 hypothetical protein [Halomonas sp. ML-15]